MEFFYFIFSSFWIFLGFFVIFIILIKGLAVMIRGRGVTICPHCGLELELDKDKEES